MKETALSPKANYTVSFTAASSTPHNVGPAGVVRLVATTACFVVFASSSTNATTSGMYLPAGVPEYFDTSAFFGTDNVFVAAIRASADGTLYITACN